MSVAYTKTLGFTDTISGKTVYSPQTTGNFYLRRSPFSVNTYTGTHIGDGVWDFGTVEDGYYQIWNASSQLIKYGTIHISDKDPVLDTLKVIGDVSITGQTNIFDSFNMNGADLAHADNIQVNTLSENIAGQGITPVHKMNFSDALRIASNLVGLTSSNTFTGQNTVSGTTTFSTVPIYSGVASVPTNGFLYQSFANTVYARLGFTNNYSGQNIFNNFAPSCSVAPTVGGHLTNKSYVDTTVNNAVLSANIGAITANFLYQVSPNLIRFLPNGINSVPNKVATSWALAMKQAKDSITSSGSSATIQQIISIEGIGITDTSIPITNTEIGTYFYPRVHVKGISQSVKLRTDDAAMDSGGSAINSIIEDVTITHDDGGFGATPTFANLTFKDVYFDFRVDSVTFSNCVFRGTNIFKMRTGNLYLNSITGTTYYTTVSAITTGDNPEEIVTSNI